MDFSNLEREKFRLRTGDLLLCEGGEVGRTAVWKDQLPECYFQKAIHRLRPRTDEVTPEFFRYWMEWAFRFASIYGVAGTETTIAHLPQDKLRVMWIPKPPRREQEAIARILAACNRVATAVRRELAAERERKAALLQHLFTHGTRGESTRETQVGSVPQSWQVVQLGSLAPHLQYGLSIAGRSAGRYPMLRMNNLSDGRLDLSGLQYVDLDDSTFEAFKLRRGDLLFNRTNSAELVGKTALFDETGTYVFASYLIRLSPDAARVEPHCLNGYLNWAPVQARLRGIATRGVSQSNISAGKLSMFLVVLPPLDEQREIAAVLSACDTKIAALEHEIALHEQLFRAMLEELMSGRLSVAPLLENAAA